MSRPERRRFEKEFAKIMKAPPDNCMVCSSAFEHNCKTFGGITTLGTTVLAGECCMRRLETIMGQGIYVTKGIDSLPRAGQTKTRRVSSEVVPNVIESIQSHFSGLDAMASTLARRAGIHPPPGDVHIASSPWKEGDAAWFRDNPSRSHRLRPLFEGEAATIPNGIMTAPLPDKHRIEILVRQIEVGKRARMIFCRNTEFPIPDSEEFIHAIFDIVAKPEKGGFISTEELDVLVRRYGASRIGKPH